ncbi:hypothetical protein M153_2140008345 [Pseudoloma neurophilia]|uniref:Uncharacterized protein n=1 Tax=Pseudoloma neurophilia TaxID=146866 RepID=A0A0R0M600_9MICR|nr:hypothetical protein M153_2140008345 [Pseudoloma neurophilia]
MDNNDQNKTHFERITMDDCICKPCYAYQSGLVSKKYPLLSCDITCQKNETVKQKCSCHKDIQCQNNEKSCDSDHLLSSETLKTLSTGDSRSTDLIHNCIEERNDDI